MILTQQELHPPIVLPGVEDRATAARVSSFVCWMAALWFFLSPWAFFGVSEQTSGWNCWIVGGLMTVISMIRLLAPRESTPFTLVNMALGVWTMCSPWIFGYSASTARTTSAVGVGACVLGFSIMSRILSRELLVSRSLSADNSD